MIYRSHEPGERLGSLNLTPPDSQSRDVSLDLQDQNEQVLFLRAYFYLEHQLRAQPEFLEDDVIQQSISTVLRHVDGSIRRNRIDSVKCMESFHNCVRLLDTHHKWNVSILSHRFTEMAARWLHSIRSSDQSGAYCSLLQILADSDFAARLGPLVVEQIARMQTSISSWQSPDALIPRKIADDFMASSYYFTLLETLIPRLSGAEKQSHVTLLPPIDDGVQVHFPLFAASLMKCVDALQK